jgi:hypothetical protein
MADCSVGGRTRPANAANRNGPSESEHASHSSPATAFSCAAYGTCRHKVVRVCQGEAALGATTLVGIIIKQAGAQTERTSVSFGAIRYGLYDVNVLGRRAASAAPPRPAAARPRLWPAAAPLPLDGAVPPSSFRCTSVLSLLEPADGFKCMFLCHFFLSRAPHGDADAHTRFLTQGADPKVPRRLSTSRADRPLSS